MLRTLSFMIILGLMVSAVGAQAEIPASIDGQAVYVPFPVAITVDGDLSDWSDIPFVTVNRGTMTSDDPAENGSFSFAVAADADNFYITMTMPDKNIIAGQHGTDFWNEDSFEFYLNLTDNLSRKDYVDGVAQFNINAAAIDNSDPTAITVTGTNANSMDVQAIVFTTDDGWGFEAAVPFDGRITPAHGLEIGFQAQVNGATEADRDVKLIWSLADTADNSWQDPSLFGSAIFFELGQTEVPMPADRTIAEAPTPTPAPGMEARVAVNEVGYFVKGPKLAMLASDSSEPVHWSLIDTDSGTVVSEGETTAGVSDEASGDVVKTIDFSDFNTPGRYQIEAGGVSSYPFEIADDIYDSLSVDAMRYFYLNRSGIALEPEYAGDWARHAGHLSDASITCFAGTDDFGTEWPGCDYVLDGSKGWYDAGDYGKYVVNGGIAAWTLMNLYEHVPQALGDGTMNIPESGNGIPDVLDEARWEMEFMLGLQVPEGEPLAGMVHHKLHDRSWSGMPSMVPEEFDNDPDNLNPRGGRYVYMPTTAATLNLAASAAQCARLWAEFDSDFAGRCRSAAERAWLAALANSHVLTDNVPGSGGGGYGDGYVQDEFFWAAAELYVTTGEAQYLNYLLHSPFYSRFQGSSGGTAMSWASTAVLGTITLASNPVPETLQSRMQQQIIDFADQLLIVQNGEGYRIPFGPNAYVWGSNGDLLNNGIILAYAYDFTGDERYLNAVEAAADYVLGRNTLNRSFVSGYGTVTMQHPHHRFWGNQPGFPPPPPGAIAGGPNANPAESAALNNAIMDSGPAKRYVDLRDSYSTNEVAINWNAPLAWVSSYLAAAAGSVEP